jgi:hypothetical protein
VQGIHPPDRLSVVSRGALPLPTRKVGRMILGGDLVDEMTEVLISLCARLYGKRACAHQAANSWLAAQEFVNAP